MAWLLGIGAAVVGGSYLVSTVSGYIGDKIKLLYDSEKSATDALQRELEEKRQEQHDAIKKKHVYHNELREKYHLHPSSSTKITNDTEYECRVVYVNHYRASNEQEAIKWAKNVLQTSYLALDVLNRLNTKTIVLDILEMMDIIIQEQKEYFIVLCVDDHFKVLNSDDYNGKNISVYNKFHLKSKDHDVDIQCSKWF
jgi:hypothetical protein